MLGVKGLKRVQNYHEITCLNNFEGVIVFSHQGKLSFHTIVYVEEDLKTYSVKIDSAILQRIQNADLDFSLGGYFDITNKIFDTSGHSEKS